MIKVTGVIASVSSQSAWGRKFLFYMEEISDKNSNMPVNALIQLNFSNLDRKINTGHRYQFFVKLKRIHGNANPGSFDYEAWALQKGIRAKGNIIVNKPIIYFGVTHLFLIERLRAFLLDKVSACLPHSQTSVWLPALMVGEHGNVPKEDWMVLRNTGTNHLMAIAGLHIGIMAGLTFLIMNWLWRLFPVFMLIIPAVEAGSCTALLMAITYSCFAGFALPTQRACIMLSVFTFIHLCRRQASAWHTWALALMIILFMNPLVVLTESFWLSFGTIAIIIYGMHNRINAQGWWWRWGRVQWIIGLGLVPITLMLFQQCSLISFIANMIAIPWLSFLILPFCFLADFSILISPLFTKIILIIADKSLALLWVFLTYLSKMNFAVWAHTVDYCALICGLFGIIILLLPKGIPGKLLSFIWLLPLIITHENTLKPDEFKTAILDVGQGLAVIVQTKNHVLIYDTGPKYGSQGDAGESIIKPFLINQGIKKIDALVISHPDNDHIGGAESLLKSFPINEIYASSIKKMAFTAFDFCKSGQHWDWGNIHFYFLHPGDDEFDSTNNRSCVLRIDNSKTSILLSGDIEKNSEYKLLKRSMILRSTVLVAPHHGSRTSSSEKFISLVQPQSVIYATGYLNRFHFPHPSVAARYKKYHIQQFNTALLGTIQIHFSNNITYSFYRLKHKRYWADVPRFSLEKPIVNKP